MHWSILQIEYATDIVFKSTQILSTLYKELVRGAVNEVEAADVYRFMGKRLTKASANEVSSGLNTYVQGTGGSNTASGTVLSRCRTNRIAYYALKRRLLTLAFSNTAARWLKVTEPSK